MEKKESLRKKLEEMINKYQGDCYWASEGWGDNVPTDDDLDKEMELLLDFISQELDKAREEGQFDEWELSYIKTLHLEATEYRKIMNIKLTRDGKNRDKSFVKKLSKLKDNK